jgi:hypothetical protein
MKTSNTKLRSVAVHIGIYKENLYGENKKIKTEENREKGERRKSEKEKKNVNVIKR